MKDIEVNERYYDDYLELKDLLNDERNPECIAVLDTFTGKVEVFDDGPIQNTGRYMVFPALDYFCPYQETIREYAMKLDLQVEKFSARFLEETGKLVEFREYRLEKAVDKLIEWMKSKQIELADEGIRKEIVEKTIEGYEYLFETTEISMLQNSSNNVRILIGIILRDLARKQMEEIE